MTREWQLFSSERIAVTIKTVYVQFHYLVSLILFRVNSCSIVIANYYSASLLRKSFARDIDDTINTHDVRCLFRCRTNLELCRCKYRFVQRHNRIIPDSSSINRITATFPDLLDAAFKYYSKVFDVSLHCNS